MVKTEDLELTSTKINDKIDYKFKDNSLLQQALTHSSYCIIDYQRLEFLGDGVINFLITKFLFDHPKQFNPGEMTLLRSALVCNAMFASLAIKCDLHKHALIKPDLQIAIDYYAKESLSRQEIKFIKEVHLSMNKPKGSLKKGPKGLADIFEALIGAVYLDSGKDLEIIWKIIIDKIMKKSINCCLNNLEALKRPLATEKASNLAENSSGSLKNGDALNKEKKPAPNQPPSGSKPSDQLPSPTGAKTAIDELQRILKQKISFTDAKQNPDKTFTVFLEIDDVKSKHSGTGTSIKAAKTDAAEKAMKCRKIP